MQPPSNNNNEDKFQALNQLVNSQPQQPPQGQAPSNQQLYHSPTPKELAYAIFILEHCFPASFQQFQHSQSISITGQDAVAFLTTSGIHRLILRILWTVVDPQNFGTLTDLAQFHTILRLVALTQAGHVEPELLSVGTLPPPKPTPVQVVWKLLHQHQTTVVPLANFHAVALPTPLQLQQIYTLHQQRAAAPTMGPPASMPHLNPLGNEFGGFNTPSAAVGAFHQGGSAFPQPEKSPVTGEDVDDFGGFSGAAPKSMPNLGMQPPSPFGMAALDSLAPAVDAPLPSLGSLTGSGVGGVSTPVPAAPSGGDDEFGGFEAAGTPATTPGGDEFGGFAGAAAPPAQPGMTALDSLGSAEALGPATMAALNSLTDAPALGGAEATGMSALDALGGAVSDAPLPALGVVAAAAATQPTASANDDEFGGFADAPAAVDAATGLGALDALGPVANAPLPGLGQAAEAPGDDDDFGGFTDAKKDPPSADDDGDEFGGFTNVAPAPSNDAPGIISAFDALAGVQDAPLPSLGPPQSERGLGSTSPLPASAIQPSLSFGADPNTGMSAFDAMGPTANAPLPSSNPPEGQPSTVDANDSADMSDGSFGSFNQASPQERKRRSLNSSLRRHSSRSIGATDESAPKDLMPSMPGERFLATVKQNSMRKLPESILDDNLSDLDDGEHADPFAGLKPAPGTLELNEMSSLGPESETMPRDLQPHSPGEHFVPHSKNATATPGGLQTLAEPNNGVEDDDFGGFTEAPPKRRSSIPNLDPASEPNPFSESIPHEMIPHAPGEHYVPHGAHHSRTPSGLATVGESAEDTGAALGDMSHLNPPTHLARQEIPMPHDLKPHKPGEHYVSHGPPVGLATFAEVAPADMSDMNQPTPGGLPTVASAVLGDISHLNPPAHLSHDDESMPHEMTPHKPGEHYVSHGPPAGLATVGEAFGELVEVEDAKLPGLGQDALAEDDFGDFADATGGGPATGDGPPEDDGFGDFADANGGAQSVPPPVQLSRQATPAAKDLDPLTKKASSVPLGSATIQEGDEDEEEDGFGDFASSATGFPGQLEIAPPTQMKRQETPRPQDLRPDPPAGPSTWSQPFRPDPPGQLNQAQQAGLGTVAETIEESFGSFAQAAPSSGAFAPPPMLSRQATPAAKDLELLPRTTTVNNNETIFEEAEEEDGFGAFSAADSGVAPPPVQLSRQATPATKDLDLLKQKGAFGGALEGMAIQEGDEEEEEGDDFGGFESAGTPGQMEMVAPPQMKRKETPRPEDIKPKLPGSAVLFTQPGLSAIGESQENIPEGGDDNSDDSSASPDPFAAFNSLAAPQAKLAPLPVHGVGAATDEPVVAPPPMAASKSLDLFTKKPSFGRNSSGGDLSVGKVCVGHRSTGSLFDEDESDDDDLSSAPRDVSSSRGGSKSPVPFRAKSRSRSPVPDRIGISQGTRTPVISEVGDDDDWDDDFGVFAGASQMPAPAQLARQATPAAKDLDPLTKKASAGVADSVTIMEEDNEEEDEFGDFGGFTGATAGAAPLPTQLSRQATPAAKDLDPLTKKASAGANAAAAIQEEDEDEEEDEFGDFGGFSSAGDAAAPPPIQLSRQATPAAKDLDPLTKKASAGISAAPAIQEGDEDGEEGEDEFGDFGGFSSAGDTAAPPPTQLHRQATPAAKDLDPLTKKASAGMSAAPVIQEGDEEEGEDEFGDFGGFAVAPPPTQLHRQATPAAKDLDPLTKKASAGMSAAPAIQEGDEDQGEDEFGDFGGFAAAPPPTQLHRQATPAAKDLDPLTKKASAGISAAPAIQEGDEEEDDFGDFGGFEQAAEPSKGTAGDNDGFGGFAAAAAPSGDDGFGDFAGFAAAPAPATSSGGPTSFDAFQDASGGNSNPVHEKMLSLSRLLPSQFLSGAFKYEKALGGIAGKTDNHKLTERCVQVLSLLTSASNGKLATTYWTQVMDVAREELSLGNRLLEEASGLSSKDQKLTQTPLEIMAAGMGEYVRATRSIVASVGDMLLLDVATPLDESTVASSWGSVSLVKKAWEVEKLWARLIGKASSQGLLWTTKLETVVEIRRKCLSRCPSTKLCQLSLQPLSDEDRQTTKATVDWGGKPFMACSANFLANKCPFYAIND